MIVRDDITAETYCPLPFSTADLRGLERAIEDRVGKLLTLDLGNTETGEPFISVMAPGDHLGGRRDHYPQRTRLADAPGW
jgi:hypothetical protein